MFTSNPTSNSNTQGFRFQQNGIYWKAISNASGKCVDHQGNGGVGNYIQQYQCQDGNTNQDWIFKPRSQPPVYLFTGKFVNIFSKINGLCATFNGENSNILETTCTDADNQVWRVNQIDDFKYSITSKVGDFSWDNQGATNQRTPYVAAKANGSVNQQIRFAPSSFGSDYFQVIQAGSQMCLDHPGNGGNGQFIGQWNCLGNSNQAWMFRIKASVHVRGSIKDATNNQLLSSVGNLSVTFTSADGTSYQARVNADSTYDVDLPTIGDYTRTTMKDGYGTAKSTVHVFGDADTYNVYISPTLVGWRIIVSWGAVPKDLDAHLLLPDGTEVNYTNKVSANGLIKLDVDSRDGFGVETITMSTLEHHGVFNYYVYNYSKDAKLSESKAKVQIYKNDELINVVEIPFTRHSDYAYYWRVLSIDTDSKVVTIVNTVTES